MMKYIICLFIIFCFFIRSYASQTQATEPKALDHKTDRFKMMLVKKLSHSEEKQNHQQKKEVVAASPANKKPASQQQEIAKHNENMLSPTNSTEHVVSDGETAWFLSNLYYGTGENFDQILKANNLTSAKSIKVGQKLVIPKPLHTAAEDTFSYRRIHLLKKREENLNNKYNNNKDSVQEAIRAVQIQPTQASPEPPQAEDTKKRSPARQAYRELEAL